jgi:ribosomal protein S18 acetylase RimI-like enzyme
MDEGAPQLAHAIHRLPAATAADSPVGLRLAALERKLWSKATSWGPELFRELGRRNVALLYAVAADGAGGDAGRAGGTGAPSSSSSTAAAADAPILGYVIYSTSSLACHVSKVVVVPEERRRGLGRALVRAALAAAVSERRVRAATLHVNAANAPALALYASLGFVADGELANYYAPGRPAFKMLLEPLGSAASYTSELTSEVSAPPSDARPSLRMPFLN